MRAVFDIYQTIHRHVAESMLPKRFIPRSKRDALPAPVFPEIKDYFSRNLKWFIAGGAICIALAILKVIKKKLAEQNKIVDLYDRSKEIRKDEGDINVIAPVQARGKPQNLPISEAKGFEPPTDPTQPIDVPAQIDVPPQNSEPVQPLVEVKNEEEETPGGPDSLGSSLIEFVSKPVPTGVVNFDENGRLLNLCYLISTLQLLRMGFESRIAALNDDADANSESRQLALMLQPVINKISVGEETVNAPEIMRLARYLIEKKMVDKPLYEQACAIELMQAILDKLNVSLFPIQKGYLGDRILERDDASHLILNLKHSDKIASTLDEALKFWAQGEPNDEGKIQVSRLQAQSLPDVLMVVLNRRTRVPKPPVPDLLNANSDDRVELATYLSLSESNGKITTPVEMPNIWEIADDYLDVAPISGEHRPEYQLHGFIIHTGESGSSGHYFVYTLESDGQWYCLNDNDVKKMGINDPELKKHQNTGVIYLYKKIAHLDADKALDLDIISDE